MDQLFHVGERIIGAIRSRDQARVLEQEIIVSDAGLKRFCVDVGDQLFQKIELQRHNSDPDIDSWYPLMVVTYVQLDEQKISANIVVSAYKSNSQAVPGVRVTYLPDGEISRVDPDWLVTYDESLASEVPRLENLPDRIDFQATVAALEQQISEHNFEFPQLISA